MVGKDFYSKTGFGAQGCFESQMQADGFSCFLLFIFFKRLISRHTLVTIPQGETRQRT